jgi:EAL domain-containing protein (putative c-di-GMP-specific phosphodiesterase class I)
LEVEPFYEFLQMEDNLGKALEREEFHLHYQPKLDLSSGKITGVEALIRWEHPEKGMVSPNEFIPFAEKSGMIIPIGEWIIRTACMQNNMWKKEGFYLIIMAVNLSARQLYQSNLIQMVQQIL